jgi:hypothetical protein
MSPPWRADPILGFCAFRKSTSLNCHHWSYCAGSERLRLRELAAARCNFKSPGRIEPNTCSGHP